MARFVDLEDDDGGDGDGSVHGQAHRSVDLPSSVLFRNGKLMMDVPRTTTLNTVNAAGNLGEGRRDEGAPVGIAFCNAATEAFQCWPIVIGIVSRIDLNTLDSLARASRLIHNGLVQYRETLIGATLRCSNEAVPVDPDQTLRYRARAGNWHYMEDGRSYHGKSGSCARDMVGECKKCAEVICRNCAIKPPAPAALRERHRRLCLTCSKAPIAALALPPLYADLPITSSAVQQAICKCETEGVWLCQPCGRSIRSTDQEYKRIWRWRNQYGEVLGGLGTGIGDGDRGVICGREEACLAARDREHEIDCDAEDARGSTTPSPGSQTGTTPPNAGGMLTVNPPGFPFPANGTIESLIQEIQSHRTPSPQLGPGYERHEIEGIGGVVKRKLVRMVRIGACVPEWEEEKGGLSSTGKVMAREVSGCARSWCGWCWRVIPGKKDKAEAPLLTSVERKSWEADLTCR